jgi:hypothetical protein
MSNNIPAKTSCCNFVLLFFCLFRSDQKWYPHTMDKRRHRQWQHRNEIVDNFPMHASSTCPQTRMIPATAAMKLQKCSHNACNEICSSWFGNSHNEITEIFPQCMHIAQLICLATAAMKSQKYSHVLPSCWRKFGLNTSFSKENLE